MGKPAIRRASPREYASQGTIHARATTDGLELEVHFCTAYLNNSEALTVCAQLIHAGGRVWGSEFLNHLQQLIEQET